MGKKIVLGKSAVDVDRLVRVVRLGLLSDKAGATARATIDAYLSIQPAIAALSAYEDVRTWINDNRPLGDLQRHIKAAEDAVKANPHDFTANWVLAICYKYGRRYDDSEQAYRTADAYCNNSADREDLNADWAELYVYTAKAGLAKVIIEGAGRTVRWHPWAYAFALHQYAFETDPNNTTTDTQWYEKSNEALQTWPDFGKNPDAQILVAANFGGIARRRKVDGNPNSKEVKEARKALAAFLAKFPDWSIKREKRGPFIRGTPLAGDPTTNPERQRLRAYRRQYARHYFQNLRTGRTTANDLPDSRTGDNDAPDDAENP